MDKYVFNSTLKNTPGPIEKILSYGYEFWYEKDHEYNAYLNVFIKKDDEIIGEAEFIIVDSDFYCQNIEVNENYQRMGIATGIYVFAEFITNRILINFWDGDPYQSESAIKFWSQENRPFGNNRN
jgi:hypothetical protein